ncbi:DEAD/DEAH box helicase [Candidatus Saccharibacteria bacterium]|nr:DEAD/DEAH box helicase [Candidatus Saccharibacteria bacterium]
MKNNSYQSRNNSRGRKPFGYKRSNNNQGRSGGGGNRRGKYIDPQKFINKAVTVQEHVAYVPKHMFADFGFIAELNKTLDVRGYTTPTQVQDRAIPEVMQGHDVIALANTGTGKTAAFVLPIIQLLKTQVDRPRGAAVLIMAPTRELAQQIDEEFKAFARGLQLYSAICVGGVNIQHQIRELARHPQVIIGTPGRLKDLSNQGKLDFRNTEILVLDEADRMLDMGFLPDIRFLLNLLPTKRQSLCFSATITPEIERLMDTMLNNPVTVSVRTAETSEHIEQDIIPFATPADKYDMLEKILAQPDFSKVLVFGETKWGVQKLADSLTQKGLRSEAIHGNKSQPQRQRALRAFANGNVEILVATDVAARGLDIPNVTHVINFDQPASYEDYIHRIGRTGRAGNHGNALTFVQQR